MIQSICCTWHTRHIPSFFIAQFQDSLATYGNDRGQKGPARMMKVSPIFGRWGACLGLLLASRSNSGSQLLSPWELVLHCLALKRLKNIGSKRSGTGEMCMVVQWDFTGSRTPYDCLSLSTWSSGSSGTCSIMVHYVPIISYCFKWCNRCDGQAQGICKEI